MLQRTCLFLARFGLAWKEQPSDTQPAWGLNIGIAVSLRPGASALTQPGKTDQTDASAHLPGPCVKGPVTLPPTRAGRQWLHRFSAWSLRGNRDATARAWVTP
jgi:hypothetical protein